MQFLGYEATVDPRIKARTDGVKDPRDRITTMCRFCAHEDYEDRNDADHIVQLRVRCGNGVTSYPVCEDCRRSHGWDRSDVRRLFNTEGDDE